MTSQPQAFDAYSAPTASSTAEQLPPPPGYLFWLGLGALLLAPFFSLVNAVVVMLTISKWSGYGAGSASLALLWMNIAAVTALGGLLFLAGIGLVLRQRWGRTLAIMYFVCTFLCAGFGGGNTMISGVVATVEIAESGGGSFMGPQPFEDFGIAAPLATPYAVALMIFMILPKTRAWARATPLPESYSGPSKVSVLSIVSMVLAIMCVMAYIPLVVASACFAIIPIAVESSSAGVMLLVAAALLGVYFATLLATLMMGLSAVKKTAGSAGRVKGQPMAWVGVIASTLLLTMLTGMTLSGVTTAAIASPSRIVEGIQRLSQIDEGPYYDSSYDEPVLEYDPAGPADDDFDY